MIKLTLDGRVYTMQWMHCKCSSYPIALDFGVHGRCGACGDDMHGSFDTKEECEKARLVYNESTD